MMFDRLKKTGKSEKKGKGVVLLFCNGLDDILTMGIRRRVILPFSRTAVHPLLTSSTNLIAVFLFHPVEKQIYRHWRIIIKRGEMWEIYTIWFIHECIERDKTFDLHVSQRTIWHVHGVIVARIVCFVGVVVVVIVSVVLVRVFAQLGNVYVFDYLVPSAIVKVANLLFASLHARCAFVDFVALLTRVKILRYRFEIFSILKFTNHY